VRRNNMEKAFPTKTYRRPEGPYIYRTEATEFLYSLERKRDDAFEGAAKELGKVLGLDEFWYEVLPEAILSFLEAWDHNAAIPAAEVYLEKQKERRQ
jgi:hypothetical protein